MRGSDQRQSRKKRQCLTCKNKGCIGHCRFAKAKGVPDQATAQPRLCHSPVEPVHWVIWMGNGYFRFPAKLNGWSERRAAGIESRIMPLSSAF